jgi:hypothetical protein
MRPTEELLKKAQKELEGVVEYIEHIEGESLLPISVKVYTKTKLLGAQSTLKDIKMWNEHRAFVDHSDIFAKDYEPKELLRTVQGILNELSQYLEWQEDNLDEISKNSVQKDHLLISQRVAQTWVKVRDWNEKGAYWNDAPEEVKALQPLDINKQAEIKTTYGSILVIGKDQDELTEELIQASAPPFGCCEGCNAPTLRLKIEPLDITRDRIIFEKSTYECEECVQEAREMRERNAYVNRMNTGNNSQLF